MKISNPETLWSLHHRLRSCRYLICLDLEATCDEYPDDLSAEARASYTLQVAPEDMETIEIGATVIDLHNAGALVGEFDSFVRPALHPKLTSFCKGLTTIEQGQVDAAGSYGDVKVLFDAFIRPYRRSGVMWCSWGTTTAHSFRPMHIDWARRRCFRDYCMWMSIDCSAELWAESFQA